jgi:hypothetical protein
MAENYEHMNTEVSIVFKLVNDSDHYQYGASDKTVDFEYSSTSSSSSEKEQASV